MLAQAYCLVGLSIAIIQVTIGDIFDSFNADFTCTVALIVSWASYIVFLPDKTANEIIVSFVL